MDTMEFKKEWIFDAEKLDEYCSYISSLPLESKKTAEFGDIRYERVIDTIKSNNIPALEIILKSIQNDSRECYVDINFCLLEACKHGNLQMFEHCLYLYMNISDGSDCDVEYKELLEYCKDNQVLSFIKKLEIFVMDGLLPSRYCEKSIIRALENDGMDENFSKFNLYREMFPPNNHSTCLY